MEWRGNCIQALGRAACIVQASGLPLKSFVRGIHVCISQKPFACAANCPEIHKQCYNT